MYRSKAILGAVALAVFSFAARVQALDLTGEWSGSVKCVTHSDAQPDEKVTAAVAAQVTQVGTEVRMSVSGVEISLAFTAAGITLTNATKPDLGYVPMVDCGAQDAGVANIFNLKAKSDLAKGSGSLKGTFTAGVGGTSPTLFFCKLSLKRTATTDPGVTVSCAFPVQ